MMKIVRIKVEKPKDDIYLQDYGGLMWDHIEKNHSKWDAGDTGVRLLYLTRRFAHDDVSLIVDADPEDLLDFLMEHFIAYECVSDFWIFDFIDPVFFPIPEDTPDGLTRFTITIDANPQSYEEIYKRITKFSPSKDLVLTYLAYTFNEYGDDILMSVLSRGYSATDSFVSKYIKPIEGVKSVRITRITGTKRLMAKEEWKEYIGPKLVDLDGVDIQLDEAGEIEDDWLTGC